MQKCPRAKSWRPQVDILPQNKVELPIFPQVSLQDTPAFSSRRSLPYLGIPSVRLRERFSRDARKWMTTFSAATAGKSQNESGRLRVAARLVRLWRFYSLQCPPPPLLSALPAAGSSAERTSVESARNVSVNIHSTAAVSAMTDHSSVSVMVRRVKADSEADAASRSFPLLLPPSLIIFCFPATAASQKHASYRCAKRLTQL